MLRLQLMGGFRAYAETGELRALARQPRRAALLTYLAVERDVPRDRVIALLWPEADAERGRHSLNQGIYSLRRLIGADWVELRADRCVVAPWVVTDVLELERAAETGANEEVIRLYQGPLLAGTSLAVTAEFDLWLDGRRASLDRLHRRARRRQLAALLAAGRAGEARRCAEEWCRLDPLEDEAQHRYMELLAAAGQRGAALRQFAVYERLLEGHGLRPLDETIALVERLQRGEAGPLPVPGVSVPRDEPHEAARDPAPGGVDDVATAAARGERAALASRAALAALLAGLFVVNWAETSLETWLAGRLPVVDQLRIELARAAHWFEGHYTFEAHELTNRLAVVGYSAAYFLAFPLILAATGLALARRPSIRPLRTYTLAIVTAYLVSLPFFLFFPVPERWWYADSGAILLSDLWSPLLINVYRPFSALDNSFPSIHVAFTTVAVLAGFAFGLRLRWATLLLGAVVVLSTMALGVHWLTDVVAGAATGVLAMAVALRLERRLTDAMTAGAAAARDTARTSRAPAAAPALEPR